MTDIFLKAARIGLLLTLFATALPLTASDADRLQLMGLQRYDYPAVSPDGSHIVFDSEVSGNRDLYLLNVADNTITRLTVDPSIDATADWFPNGEKLVFQSERSGNRDLFTLDLATGAIENLTDHPAEDSHPKVAADGQSMVFDSNRSTFDPGQDDTDPLRQNYEIYRLSFATGETERLTDWPHWDTYADLSNDGQQLTWRRLTQNADGTLNSEVFLKDLSSGEEQNITRQPAFDGYPDFMSDGRILFASNRFASSGRDFDVYAYEPATGKTDRLTFVSDHDRYPRGITRPRAAPDGSFGVGNGNTSDQSLLVRFALRPKPGLVFRQVTSSEVAKDGGLSRGLAWGDGNGDGLIDLLIGNTIDHPNFLYWNSGNGRFQEALDQPVARDAGWSEGVNWVDVDNDGDLDIFAARTRYGNALFINDGEGNFVAGPSSDLLNESSSANQACWLDVDNDGLLDAILATLDGADTALYFNIGQGVFEAAEPNPFAGSGGNSRGCAVGDADGDGDLDVTIANFTEVVDGQLSRARDQYFENLGSGRFRSSELAGLTDQRSLTYSHSWTDVDDDGDMDLTQTRLASADKHVGIYLNNDGQFSSAYKTVFEGLHHGPSKGHAWADFDNDGDQDMIIVTGTEGIEASAQYTLNHMLFENREGRLFRVESGSLTSEAHISAGVAVGDFDNDGDLDIAISNWGHSDENNQLFRNDSQAGNWLMVTLQGSKSNRMGVGALVSVTADVNGSPKTQSRAMLLQSAFAGGNDTRLHFGLGQAEAVDTITVTWPSGQVSTLRDQAVNQILHVRES